MEPNEDQEYRVFTESLRRCEKGEASIEYVEGLALEIIQRGGALAQRARQALRDAAMPSRSPRVSSWGGAVYAPIGSVGYGPGPYYDRAPDTRGRRTREGS